MDEKSSIQFRKIPLRVDSYSLPEGAVEIAWPSLMSEASRDEVLEWLAIVAKKIERVPSWERVAVLPKHGIKLEETNAR